MFAWADNYDVQETRRTARAEGREEGRKEGREEGEKKGRKEGERSGKQAAALAIAKNAVQMELPVDDIVKLTGLTREEVENLRDAE